MVKKSVTGVKLSSQRMTNAAKTLRKKENKVWGIARKAPMFMKKSFEVKERVTGKGNEKMEKVVFKRTQRCITSNVFRVYMSGAANYVASHLKNRCATFREKYDGEGRSPSNPMVSEAAAAVLEFFAAAYAKQALHVAVQIRDGLGTSKRLNSKMMEAGFDTANASIGMPPSLAPRTVAVANELKEVKGKKAEDKAYEPPVEEEEEEEEEAAPEDDDED